MSCKFELEHTGINQANADEAAKLAEQLSAMFNLAPKHGNKSEFAGPYFECMKSPFLGTNGHIAMRTPDLAAAMEELKGKGYSFNGSIKNVYLAGEFGGFAIHIMQK